MKLGPEQGATAVINLRPTRPTSNTLGPTCSRPAWARPSRVSESDGDQDKTDTWVWRSTCDLFATISQILPSWASDRVTMGASGAESPIWSLTGTCGDGLCYLSGSSPVPLLDGMSPFSCHWLAILYLYFLTHMWLGSRKSLSSHSGVGRKLFTNRSQFNRKLLCLSLMWFGICFHVRKLSRVTY